MTRAREVGGSEFPRFGQAESLRMLAVRVGDVHTLVRIAAHAGAAWPDDLDQAVSKVSTEVNRYITILKLHLNDAADRLDRKTSAAARASERAERTVNRHIEQLQAAAVTDAFVPHGFFVYCLWGRESDVPLYVGQSTNVLARLGAHLGDSKKRHQITRVSLIKCKTRASMASTEWRLIAEYQPLWNVIGTRSDGSREELPLSRVPLGPEDA